MPVRCIHGWIFRPTFGGEGLTGSFVTELLLALEHDAKNLVERIVTEVAGETPDVELTCAAAEGPPAQVLLEAAADAYGGFAGLLLGSVSKQCARHAPCPVVIVRGRQEKGLL